MLRWKALNPVSLFGEIAWGAGKEERATGSLLLAFRTRPVNSCRRRMDENVSKCVEVFGKIVSFDT